jgi:hypothetical protein
MKEGDEPGDDGGEDDEEEGEYKEGSDGEETDPNDEIRNGSPESEFTQRDKGNDDSSQVSDDTDAPVGKLAELVFPLRIFFIPKEFANGQPSSNPLVYYSGVLGFSADGSTFRRPRDYTPQLLALIYIQHLLQLEFALPSRGYTYVCLP